MTQDRWTDINETDGQINTRQKDTKQINRYKYGHVDGLAQLEKSIDRLNIYNECIQIFIYSKFDKKCKLIH